MEELWKQVDRYEGRYEISNCGRMRRIKTGRIMACSPDKKGYMTVALTVNAKDYTARVHVLVAEAFIGPRPERLTINHKDGDKRNNKVNNLEYITMRENMIHAVATGLCPHLLKLNEDSVRKIRELSQTHSQRQLAEMFGVRPGQINMVIHRKCWGWVA